ncbi:hypothetical protein ACPWT1_06650 [Ramlibacter sp. MMS24-I3-19]|uniref:hypothetical protein n=1 Tax=Ramlibacter sp. MMS24-I3-19 TaxID=3416606 RepID=UPI003D086BB7
MGMSTFRHGPAADVREDDAAAASDRSVPRSLLASPWFWIGGLVSMAIWAGLYAVLVR